MRFSILLLTSVLLIFNFASCKLGSLDDPIVISDVEKEFYVDLKESLTPPGRQLIVDIRTIENEACLNTTIAAELNRDADGFNISISHIAEPADCQQGEAPATISLNLGATGVRTYDFGIDLKNTIYNLGKLSVDGNRYVVEMQTEEGIIFLHDELLRIPNATVWGFVAGDEAGLDSESESFVGELADLGNHLSYLKGFYHYFTINQDNSLDVNHPKFVNRSFVKPFIFDYTQDKTIMVDKLSAFRSAHPTLDVFFFTATGEEW